MASIKFLQARVSGKEAEIAKLEEKLSRIAKAEASGWEDNPYAYNEYDKKRAESDLSFAKDRLAHYQAKLALEENSQANRNIPVILEFLSEWKARNIEFYESMLPKYAKAVEGWYREDREYCNWFNRSRFDASPVERKQRRLDREHSRVEFNKTWSWIIPYIDGHELNMSKLNHDLDMECNRKYDNLVARVTKIVGTITDVSNLTISRNLELNGYIIGTEGTAEVETIGAGGWNIQRFHFRTLVKKRK